MSAANIAGTADGARAPIVYGRRHGPRLRRTRKALLENLLPRLRLVEGAVTGLSAKTGFSRPMDDIWLEIGFGGGEHLAAQAARHPNVGFIGCEPYINGVARLLSRIEDDGLDNIRLLADDARPLVADLPEACLGRAFILFPDPWPKKRHHKRRLISRELIAGLGRAIRPGGELRIATDHGEYARWILQLLCAAPAFQWLAEGPGDWRRPPEDWTETRYQIKAAAAGRQSMFLRFARRARRP